MHFNIKRYAASAAVLMALSGCVDDNYDLSDIDTTTQIKVNDLVLPINIDTVTLSDIISIDENSKIKVVTIGDSEFYALSEKGDFSSDSIFVEKVTAKAPTLDPSERELEQVIAESPARCRAGAVGDDYICTYEIVEMGNDISYHAESIDKAIEQLDSAKVEPMNFKVHLEALNVDGKVEKMYFTDLNIQMPRGLDATVSEGGEYNAKSGVWEIDKIPNVNGATTDAVLTATGIDFKTLGCQIENHQLNFDGEFRVKSGLLTIEPKYVNGVPQPLPEKLKFRVSYEIDDMTVTSFYGRISYKLEGMDIDPVSLSDIPDFLSGEETVLGLANPQIYLQLNNPVANDKLECTAGLTLSAVRENQPTQYFSLTDGTFTVPYDGGDIYNFVLAPDEENIIIPEGFENPAPKPEKFDSLGLLLGDPKNKSITGLPDQIGITLSNPQIPSSPANDFKLGRKIPGVGGKYELMAPLALMDGSKIVYTDTEDGWNDEDVDALTITKLTVTAVATNTCPVGAELTAWPIDKDGKRITDVKLKSTKLAANSADQELTIEMTGTITHLDGITFEARVDADSSKEPLSPSQTITLKNIRARVSGYYEKEL